MPSGIYQHKKGQGGRKGRTGKYKHSPNQVFQTGHVPWHKGLKGVKTNNRGKPAWNKGIPLSEEIRKKMSISRKGKKLSETHKKNISESKKGNKSYQWKEDRNSLSRYNKQGERRTSAYNNWRKQVWLRDNFKCKIENLDCKGRLETHHILSWSEHPELRYEINNGITLCHAHHPRKRAEEKRLIPTFQELVSVSKATF